MNLSKNINNLSTGIKKNGNFITQKNNKTAKLIDCGGVRNSNYSIRDINYASPDVGRPVNEDCDVTVD